MNSSLLFVLALSATLLFVATISAFGMFQATHKPAALKVQPGTTKPAQNIAASDKMPPKVNTKAPTQPTSLIASTTPSNVKHAAENMKTGERLTVVIKSDRCPWCIKFMSVLDALRKSGDKTLGSVYVVDTAKDTKDAVGSVIAQGMESFRGLPHTIILDRSETYYTVASFGGFVPRDKLGDALAKATKKKIDI